MRYHGKPRSGSRNALVFNSYEWIVCVVCIVDHRRDNKIRSSGKQEQEGSYRETDRHVSSVFQLQSVGVARPLSPTLQLYALLPRLNRS